MMTTDVIIITIGRLSIISNLKPLLYVVKIEKSSNDGEYLQYKSCSWIAVSLLFSIFTIFPVRYDMPKCSQVCTLK